LLASWSSVAQLVWLTTKQSADSPQVAGNNVCVGVQVMQQIIQMTVLPLQQRLRTLLTASDILK